MGNVIVPPRNDHFEDLIYNEYDTGWNFGAGEPEFWKFSERLLVPGGKLLDVGVGLGKTSLYFVLNGMDVHGIGTDSGHMDQVAEMMELLGRAVPVNFTSETTDLASAKIPEEQYDTTILGKVIHLPSREASLQLIRGAYSTVKPGGHLWVRLAGKEASTYDELLWAERFEDEVTVLDRHVIEHPCMCSGDYRLDPTVFLDPFDPHAVLASEGARIVHSQTIPTKGRMNIMFGEDFNRDNGYLPQGGMITVIAQKPEACGNPPRE